MESESLQRACSLVQFLFPPLEGMPEIAAPDSDEPASSTAKSRNTGVHTFMSSADSPFTSPALTVDGASSAIPHGEEGQDEAPALREQGGLGGRTWVHAVGNALSNVDMRSGSLVMSDVDVEETLDAALAGAFMAGMDNVDWYEAVQEAYGLDPEELLEQQLSMMGGDEEASGEGCYYTAGFDTEQRAGRRGQEEEEEREVVTRRPSIWH
jgi:hypothetical protein